MIGAAGWRTASTTRRWWSDDVELVAVCDLDSARRDERVRLTASMHDTPTTER